MSILGFPHQRPIGLQGNQAVSCDRPVEARLSATGIFPNVGRGCHVGNGFYAGNGYHVGNGFDVGNDFYVRNGCHVGNGYRDGS